MSLGVVLCSWIVAVAACGTRSDLLPAVPASNGGSDGSAGAGAAGAAGQSGVVTFNCAGAANCPGTPPPCFETTCDAGTCTTRPLARGTRLPVQATLCHAMECDGAGNVVEALDPSNAPSSPTACSFGVCRADGSPSLVRAAAGTPCGSGGGAVCDGLGACVQCLTDSGCFAGQMCVHNACASPSCANKIQDGDESDVDCGGSCPACGLGARCSRPRDCASVTCDPVMRRCIADPCHDRVRDGDETDVDCGNSCEPCAVGRRCKVDVDCISDDCDPAQLVCLPTTCIDQVKDANETGVDCGGGTCPPCIPGQGCLVDADCSVGCDLATHLCSGNVCNDHRRNALETDVDCGGGVCNGCLVGKMCNNNGDCLPGHFCNGSKVCQ
jgi:hypothetical protein